MKNNKGLSTVVTTLIIILLVLVAVGIIWGVVNNLLNTGRESVDSSAKCMDLEISATRVVNTTYEEYSVTFSRTARGEDMDGVLVVLYNDAGSSSDVIQVDRAISPTAVFTQKVDTTSALFSDTNLPTKIKVTPFYLNDEGKRVVCATEQIYTFSL